MPGTAKADAKLGFFFVGGAVAFLILFGIVYSLTGGIPGLSRS